MQRRRRTSSRRIRRTASQVRLLPKLLMALGLSIILLILTRVQFDENFAAGEKQPLGLGLPENTLLEWALQFQDLMERKYFSSEWVKGLEEFKGMKTGGQGRGHLFLSYPAKYRIHSFISETIRVSEGKNFELVESYEGLNPPSFGLGFSTVNGDFIQLQFNEEPELEWLSGRIAIIIDDFGYRMDETVNSFMSQPLPITVAIIPGTEFAKQVAERANNSGMDVLIHLPMEPIEAKVENAGYTVFTGMSEDEIDEVIEHALEDVPGAIGINNHMGSKATADRATMDGLMRCLKKRNLLFVDSITNRSSVAYQLAKRNGIAALKLTTFLDNEENPAAMTTILRNTINRLPETNTAILIGHVRDETSRLLPAEMRKWAAKGISFVKVSDLLESP